MGVHDSEDQSWNGLANANIIAIPTPIRKAASIETGEQEHLGWQRVHQLG